MKNVDVIIVNYRTKELTAAAVRSVLREPELARVLIVENTSGDDSADYLRDAFINQPVEILISAKNLGFGGANNFAATLSTAKYLFFLNSDAVLRPGGLDLLRTALEEHPKTGVVAPAVYIADGETLQSDAQGAFPTPLSLMTRGSKKTITDLHPDWVSGVAFMVRREEFLDVGGFDPVLFMYYEDIDLCRRYRAAGFTILRELKAEVVHLGGASRQSSLKQKTQYFQSQDQYLRLAGYLSLSRLLVRIMRSPYVLFGRLFLWK
jgi:N-acetylglucosaminyl-diphospho-decaprenol L-rhamnosyltransferase